MNANAQIQPTTYYLTKNSTTDIDYEYLVCR